MSRSESIRVFSLGRKSNNRLRNGSVTERFRALQELEQAVPEHQLLEVKVLLAAARRKLLLVVRLPQRMRSIYSRSLMISGTISDSETKSILINRTTCTRFRSRTNT